MCRDEESARPASSSWLMPRRSRHVRSRAPTVGVEVVMAPTVTEPAGPDPASRGRPIAPEPVAAPPRIGAAPRRAAIRVPLAGSFVRQHHG
ncbi:hypothetical protein GCM10010215_33050 [Streptomyces virginiae]|uniref:Uncharacterized protein n=1 Tax=Streptomyces virginiae TaxID=1961 RepID=A0ABQ3NHP1_STRVG|nr:hypothetical protein GCM10010215_33050 [Streptomyces virginiae]GHI12303.1 hypothetical protein Scinn_17660 [Streptomyces virginiae]